jgi:hypothetical protein
MAFLALALAQSNGSQSLLQIVTKAARLLVNSGLLHLEFAGNVPKWGECPQLVQIQ